MRLYLTLKQSNKRSEVGTKQGRITPATLNQWKHTVHKEVALSRSFYMDEKAVNPSLGGDLRAAKYLRNPSQMEDWPAHVGPDMIWLVNDALPTRPT